MRIIFAFILSLHLLSAWGGTEGGGGDVVILPDGSVVLADSYLDTNAPQPNNMPQQIVLGPKLLLQVKVYTEFIRQIYKTTDFLRDEKSDILNLFDILGSRDNKLAFYAVKDAEELNHHCASGGKKSYRLENGQKVEQVACTSGNEVYLVIPLFARMNLEQQVLLLYHERMTTLRDAHGGKNYQAIAGFTSGLHVLFKVAYEQQQGEERRLTEDERNRIRQFYLAVFELEYRNRVIPIDALDWSIHSNGGGMLRHSARVDETAFVGVNSFISNESFVGANSKIKNTSIPRSSVVEENVNLEQVILNAKGVIGKGVSIIKSSIISKRIEIGADSKISKSIITASHVKIGERNLIKNSQILFDIIQNRNDTEKSLITNNDQSLEDGLINEKISSEYASVEQKVRAIRFGRTIPFGCQGSLKLIVRNYPEGTCWSRKEIAPGRINLGDGNLEKETLITKTIVNFNVKELNLKKGDVVYLLTDKRFTLVISNNKRAKEGEYLLQYGRFVQAGESRFAQLRLPIEEDEILSALYSEVKSQGGEMMNDTRYWVTIKLPLEIIQ